MSEEFLMFAWKEKSFTLTIFALVIGVAYIYKFFLDNIISHRKIKLEGIRFLKEALNSGVLGKNLVVEKAFEAVYGYQVDYKFIKVLIDKENPNYAISKYIKGRHFLQLSEDKTKIIARKNYKSTQILGFKLYLMIIVLVLLYTVLAFPGLWILLYSAILFNAEKYTLGLLAVVIGGVLCVLALICLLLSKNMNEAMNFVEQNGS